MLGIGRGLFFGMLALGACDAGGPAVDLPAAAEVPDVAMEAPGGGVAWRALDVLEGARIALPEAPGDAPHPDGVFPLGGPWEATEGGVGRLRAWSHPLPFRNAMPRPNYAPHGARLFRGEREIPFVNDVSDLRAGGWYVEAETLKLLSLEDPSRWREPAELRAPEIATQEARRAWDPAAGLSPAAFVATTVTIGPVTRPGLHLPAGGSVAFDVDVPAGATLEWGVAPLPHPTGGDEAEGGARAVVRIDGQVLAEDAVAPGDALADRTASLAAWAGKRVAIELFAEPGIGAGRGHVVFTAPTIRRPPSGDVRRVVVVGVDTLRADALGAHGYGRPTSPELDAWASQMVVFDRAYAPAPRTFPSFRTATTGRYPLSARGAPTLAEHLRPLGFRTAGIVANVHLVPRFGFADGFEHWYYENGARAADQVDRALAWLGEHRDEDSFLFLHLMDPHTWYNAPEPYGSRFQEGPRPEEIPEVFDRWHLWRLMKRKAGISDAGKRWVRSAYDGEVAYVSAQIARFLSAVDQLPGKTLVVLHTDHGEEFWEHGGYEHNHSLYDELVRAVLWVRPPRGWAGGPHRVDAPVGLVDLVPTVLDVVGAPAAPTDGRSLRAFVDPARAADRDALATALEARPLQVGHLMFGTERWGVVADGHKYILHTGNGREEVYDLRADPGETTNLADTAPPARLDALRAALAEATGWPVKPGWRLRMASRAPFRVAFDAPVADAGPLDPETERETRSNVEWGEPPQVPTQAVATVRRSPDGLGIEVQPGPAAVGRQVWIVCDGPCPAARVVGPGGEAPLADGAVAAGTARLQAAAGWLLVQPAGPVEAHAPAEQAQLEALQQLGYIDGE